MGYVEKNLMPDEKILFIGKIHWIVYLLGGVAFIIGLILPVGILKSIFITVGLFYLIRAFIFTKTTELIITSKRVIAKFGLIRRSTVELNHNQVESLNVEQGIIDRIVNAGGILIKGTGGSSAPIPSIAKPLEFRKEYFSIVEDKK